jgi:hypothetical protein
VSPPTVGEVDPIGGWPENSSCWNRLLETWGFGALGAWRVPEQDVVAEFGEPTDQLLGRVDPGRPLQDDRAEILERPLGRPDDEDGHQDLCGRSPSRPASRPGAP